MATFGLAGRWINELRSSSPPVAEVGLNESPPCLALGNERQTSVDDLLVNLPAYLTFLAVSCWIFHSREQRILRASLYAGFATGAATITLIGAIDQHTWNPMVYLASFLIYGLPLSLFSSFLAWLAGMTIWGHRQ